MGTIGSTFSLHTELRLLSDLKVWPSFDLITGFLPQHTHHTSALANSLSLASRNIARLVLIPITLFATGVGILPAVKLDHHDEARRVSSRSAFVLLFHEDE